MGDPAGVGPEIVLQAAADAELAPLARWIVVGDTAVLEMAQRITGVSLQAELRDPRALAGIAEFQFGRLDASCGVAAVEYVRIATGMCLSGEAEAMVTAPLNKEAVTLSGRCSERLSTIHVTTHVPLRAACETSTGRILRTIELGSDAMKLLGMNEPRIAVCGLNPHAGEHGLFGDEDQRIILPAIEAARAKGIPCSGPHAPDTVFLLAARGAYDLVVAMYHDQGHIPMKLIDFEGTVNISLGIPIIRTSVDHGTAFDIAGKNRADARSMKQAMRVAARMASTRRRTIAAE
ncbi:MAG: 4-hydroxythreonine-4-phosphate dehydrogenase PdxA [Candidatus Solibacter sp.]|nr:4-hydroxythreonine-4-phosphate dehydrogenase PdxA [Candidatus Solibacter sp.]